MPDSYWVIPEDDFDILHYGVKGMKWGVRKSEYRSMSRNQKKQAKNKYKADKRDQKSRQDVRRREFLAKNQNFETRKKRFAKDGKKFVKGFLATNLLTLGVAKIAPDFTELTAYIGNLYNLYNLAYMGADQIVYNYDLDAAMKKKKGVES